MTNDDYFIGKSGKRFPYADIAKLVRDKAPETLGKHISIQLAAIGLLEEMEGGVTPCGLPFTFASGPNLIRKQLTSTGIFYTPGLFRALQNDYRIKGKTRQRAVQILSDGYGLPVEEARGLLSGSIPVEIDEDAGTITYEVSEADHESSVGSPSPVGSPHDPSEPA
jgi:hypothetical protein